MNPRTEAIAYRIWAYCAPRGWDCLVSEVAEELGLPPMQVRRICDVKGWHHRLRGVSHHRLDAPMYLANEVAEQGPVYI